MAVGGYITTAAMITELTTRGHLASGDATQILFWLQEAQDKIEKLRSDWRFCMALGTNGVGTSIATVANQFAYDLPADFSHFIAVWDHTNNKRLYPKSLEWVISRDPDLSETGDPSWYVRLGPRGTASVESVGFYVIPGTSSDAIKHYYYKRLPALANSATYTLVPDCTLLMLMAERRIRIHNEEPEDGSVIRLLDEEIAERTERLVEHNSFDLDDNDRIFKDGRIGMKSGNW